MLRWLFVEAQDRLAELLGALSLATDRARGQAPESALGTTILATRLAGRMGLPDEELVDTYFAALTRTLGCTSLSMDAAALALGDDRSFTYALHMSDLADPGSVRAGLETHFALGAEAEKRTQVIDAVMDLHPQFPYIAAPICQQAVALARRLPVPPNVATLLADLDARWDGKNPTRPGGEEIPLPVRIIEFATVVELYRRAGGVRAALDVASARSGRQFDPNVCSVFERYAPELLEGFEESSLWDLFVEAEPAPAITIGQRDRRVVAEISADFADQKSGWFMGNSRKGASLAVAAAERRSLSEEDCTAVGLASLMRDLGRCAVPNGIWDKRGSLTEREVALVRTHSQHTEEILASSPSLRPIAQLAGSAHERSDGSGYHRGSQARDQRAELIAASDVYVSLISDRPWRDARSESAASEILNREAEEGRLWPAAVHAVLEARGHQRAAVPEQYPDGLTKREVEVLRLLAQGLLTKEIAAKLGIAYKTVDNHVQNLYRKIGASTRTGAAMYAVEHDLYD